MGPFKGMKRLVLLGPGHAHLRAIRDALLRPVPGWEVILVAPGPVQLYSGMVPGFLAGQYAIPELSMDLPSLCRSRGVWFMQDWAEGIDLAAQRVHLAHHEALGFDLLSLNLGGLPAADDVPGAQKHATFLKPLTTARLGEVISGEGPIVVVGGGAGGLEVAFCLHARTGRHTTIVSAARMLPPGASRSTRRTVWEAIKARNLPLWLRTRVVAVHPGEVELHTRRRIPYGQLIWVTGARAPPLPAASGLTVDDAGFLLVQPTLRSVSHPFVFGAGDTITIEGHRHLVRNGVHAVREGRVLGTNLRALMTNHPITERYSPDENFLSLLNLGDGTAIASRGNWCFEGRAAFWLKDAIDRRWVRSLRA